MVRNFFEMFLRARQALEFSHSQDPQRTRGRRIGLLFNRMRLGWLLRSRWRGRASNELAAGIVAPGMNDQLLNELLGIGGEESLRIPGGGHPSPDRRLALNQRHSTDPLARNQRGGRDHRDPIPFSG